MGVPLLSHGAMSAPSEVLGFCYPSLQETGLAGPEKTWILEFSWRGPVAPRGGAGTEV